MENTQEWNDSKSYSLFFSSFFIFKLWKYDNTFTEDLENTEKVTHSSTLHYNYFFK